MSIARSLRAEGFLFDANRCTGCDACVLACTIENQLDWRVSWRQVFDLNPRHAPNLLSHHLSLACNHCGEAPCKDQCPARAISREPRTGAILIDAGHCIGCGYCAWVCPFDAPVYDDQRGVMTKCSGCSPLLAQGQPPACVRQCPTGALGFGPLLGAEEITGFARTELSPAIRFTALREDSRRPLESPRTRTPAHEVLAQGALAQGVLAQEAQEQEAPEREAQAGLGSRNAERRESAISLRREWPLWGFSLVVTTLAGLVMGPQGLRSVLGPVGFTVLAAGAALGSSLHLGRRAHAYRAFLNLRHSWLSREIASFMLFCGFSFVLLLRPGGTNGAAWPWPVAACLGAWTVFVIDRVYDPVRSGPSRFLHSADCLPTALMIATMGWGWWPGALLLASAKAVLFAWRPLSSETARSRRWWKPAIPVALCIGGGMLLPALLWWTQPAGSRVLAVLVFAVAEAADRALFYTELEPPSPRAEIRRLLRRAA